MKTCLMVVSSSTSVFFFFTWLVHCYRSVLFCFVIFFFFFFFLQWKTFLCVVFVNEKFCKDPPTVTADDFFFSGLNILANTANKVGFNVTLVNVDMLLGLNTLGIFLAHLDFAPYGLDPPHTHPRASEILVVAEGTQIGRASCRERV